MNASYLLNSHIDLSYRLEKVEQAATELSRATGQGCSCASADVRDKEKLKAAVAKCASEFGRIDFVICGMSHHCALTG